MSHNPLDKIQALDAIEKEIIQCLQSAGQSFQELGKEKTSQKAVENHTQQFLKSLKIIETKLSEQINYLTQVSTGQPHEGSGYASAKVLQMAWHRIQHARSRVREMDDSKTKYKQLLERQQQKHSTLTTSALPAAPSPTAGPVAATTAAAPLITSTTNNTTPAIPTPPPAPAPAPAPVPANVPTSTTPTTGPATPTSTVQPTSTTSS